MNRKTAALTPYTPGEQPKDKKYIKINTNENPYPPSPKALQAAKEAIGESLKLYPDPEASAVVEAVSQVEGVPSDWVFVGNGSDEVLAFCFSAFFEPEDKPVLFPDVTYSFYPVYASEYRVNYQRIPLDEEYRIRIEDYLIDNGGIIFPNPNAPTAIALELDEIRTLAEKTKGLLIVDEAYVAFGAQSAVSLTKEYDNILVVRTLSKSHSLAGIRLGYAIGQPALIEGLNRVKNSFNSYTIDRIACVCARESILDTDYARINAEKIMATRERVSRHLEGLGFTVLPSKANFVFISHPRYQGGEMMSYLRERGILVRHFTGERTAKWLRVTIGTDGEMDAFLLAMDELISRGE